MMRRMKRNPIAPFAVVVLAGLLTGLGGRRGHDVARCSGFAGANRRGCRPAGDDQPILRRVPQRPRQDRRRQLRGTHGGEHRRACRSVRKGRAQVARARHAAARRQTAGRQRPSTRWSRWLEDSLDRAAGQGAHSGPGRAAPAQSQGICKRGSGSAGRRVRCDRDPAGRRHRRRLRQHRDGVAGVALLHRAIRHRGARRGREGRGPAGCETRRVDVPRRTRHAAHPRRRAFRSARAAAFSRKSISRRTANTSSTSPTWPPTSGATAWSTRTRWW